LRAPGARGVTTSPGLRWPSLGDDVAAWLLSYGAVLEAAIATATLPHRRARRCPEERGGGRPVVGTAETLRAAGLLRRRCGASGRIRQRPARRGPGSAWVAPAHAMWAWRKPRRAEGGRAKCASASEVELLLLHRGRAMDFAVGLLPFQDGIAAVGAVGGRGSGRCSGLGVDAAKPPREAAGGERAVGLGPLLDFSFCMPVHGSRLLRGRAQRLGDGSLRHAAARVVGRSCGASAGDPVRHHGGVGGSSG